MTTTLSIFFAALLGLVCLGLDIALKTRGTVPHSRWFEGLTGLPLIYIPVSVILLAEGRDNRHYVELASVALVIEVLMFILLRTSVSSGYYRAVGLALSSTCVFAAMLLLRPEVAHGSAEPQISIDVPDQVYQRQVVIVKTQPPLAPGQTVQVWLQGSGTRGDSWWPSCEEAQPDRSNVFWKTTCKFGSDDFPVQNADKFAIGAFYTANKIKDQPFLCDSAWKLLNTQRGCPNRS